MEITNSNLEKKIKSDFAAYFGYEPTEFKIDGEYVYAHGFYCRTVNGKTIRRINGTAWRRDN